MQNIEEKPYINALECSKKHAISASLFNEIFQCANGTMGKSILYQNGLKTNTLEPNLFYVPWLKFDNFYSNEAQILAERDLASFICLQFDVNKFF